jgi:hypothetical protein
MSRYRVRLPAAGAQDCITYERRRRGIPYS